MRIPADAADGGHTPEQSAARQDLVEVKETLLKLESGCCPDGESYIEQNRADIADMVIQPFEFEQQRADNDGTFRNVASAESFYGMAVGNGMPK